MIAWLLLIAAYLVGSISSAIITCRVMGLPDPREQGSGNPGATNVMRIGGKKAAAVTLAGDLLKGLLPVLAAHYLGVSDEWLVLIGLAAFTGHLYPVFFGFKGGKGVATTIGVLLGFNWLLGLAFVVTWLAIYKIGKISSLSALCAAVLAPLYAWFLLGKMPFVAVTLAMTAVLLWRHKSNIQRLLSGQEN